MRSGVACDPYCIVGVIIEIVGNARRYYSIVKFCAPEQNFQLEGEIEAGVLMANQVLLGRMRPGRPGDAERLFDRAEVGTLPTKSRTTAADILEIFMVNGRQQTCSSSSSLYPIYIKNSTCFEICNRELLDQRICERVEDAIMRI